MDFFSVVMISGGKSTSNIFNIYKQNVECMKVLEKKIILNLISLILFYLKL